MANSATVTSTFSHVAENGLAANDRTRTVFVSFLNTGTANVLVIPGAKRILGGLLTRLSTGSAQTFIRNTDLFSNSAGNLVRLTGVGYTGTATGMIVYK